MSHYYIIRKDSSIPEDKWTVIDIVPTHSDISIGQMMDVYVDLGFEYDVNYVSSEVSKLWLDEYLVRPV